METTETGFGYGYQDELNELAWIDAGEPDADATEQTGIPVPEYRTDSVCTSELWGDEGHAFVAAFGRTPLVDAELWAWLDGAEA